MTGDNPQCAHRAVSQRTEQVPYDGPDGELIPGSPNVPIKHGQTVTRGWWECDFGCGTKFWPVPEKPSEGDTLVIPVTPMGKP